VKVAFKFYKETKGHCLWKETSYARACHISHVLGITERRVHQLAKKGIIPRNKRGEYDIKAAVQGYIEYLQILHDKEIHELKNKHREKVTLSTNAMKVIVQSALHGKQQNHTVPSTPKELR